MCGFVGFLGGSTLPLLAQERLLVDMSDAIVHRGPDDAGYWSDAERRIGLGHRRLSILDLSAAGRQPMASASGRYILAFNGEIYNHWGLRRSLEADGQAPSWRGHSDTETLLAGFDVWGIQPTLERTVGMFAFAVWDRQTSTLILARDRVGEKPLYFGWQGEGNKSVFLFGSELKALRIHPSFEGRIDRGALSLQLRHSYVPAPYSIYEGIAKLRPGCMLSISLQQREPRIWAYWDATCMVETAVANPLTDDCALILDKLEYVLRDAIHQQMVADVPLGAFLSGGVDSSTVVALMQAQSSRPVKTFTIGFNEKGFNEAEHAKAVASYLGTDHTELYVTPQEALAVIPRLPTLYDEPFSDSSQIPTYLVSQLARKNVTVALSGDAGDELFGGYNRYHVTAQVWRKLAAIPQPLRKLVSQSLANVSPAALGQLADFFSFLLPQSRRLANAGDKLSKGIRVMASPSPELLYLGLVSHWHDPASVVLRGHEPPTLLSAPLQALSRLNDVQRMMALDMLTYLPDDILTKVDRAAMSVSLETRVPFLDHRVVEFAWRLPLSMKLREGQTKWALRQILYRHVPRKLIERPKMGFGVPIGEWLRGPLREWAEALLDPERLRREGFFDPKLIGLKWQEHISGKGNWQHHLWDVLMFQAWLEQQ